MSNPEISPAEYTQKVMAMIAADDAIITGERAADLFFQMWQQGKDEFATMTRSYAMAVLEIVDPTFAERYEVEIAYSHGPEGRVRTITRVEKPKPPPLPSSNDVVDGKLHFWGLSSSWAQSFFLVAAKTRDAAWQMMLKENEYVKHESIEDIIQLEMPKKAGILISTNFEE